MYKIHICAYAHIDMNMYACIYIYIYLCVYVFAPPSLSLSVPMLVGTCAKPAVLTGTFSPVLQPQVVATGSSGLTGSRCIPEGALCPPVPVPLWNYNSRPRDQLWYTFWNLHNGIPPATHGQSSSLFEAIPSTWSLRPEAWRHEGEEGASFPTGFCVSLPRRSLSAI